MRQIPKATLKRYPIYLKALRKIKSEGISDIRSAELAEYVDIRPTTIRRDFSLIGSLGKQGFGYDVDRLIEIFSGELGVDYDEKIILIGAGRLGRAILNYNRWSHVAGEIVCAFDLKPEKCKDVEIPIYDVKDLREKMPSGCRIAILCVPDVDDTLISTLADLGIKGVVNFAREHFNVPRGMVVRNVDVVTTIQEIVFEVNSLNE